MNRMGPYFIVAMSLSFVLIITLAFMFNILSGNSSAVENNNENLISVPEEEVINNEGQNQVNKENPEDNSQFTEGELEDTAAETNLEEDVFQDQDTTENKGLVDSEEKTAQIPTDTSGDNTSQLQVVPQKVDKYLNRETNNTNILCLGIADGNLEMISLYSINKKNLKSAGIFLPTRTALKVNGQIMSLKNIYQSYGVLGLKKIISQCLEVDIPYHMAVDKQGLVELSKIIGPLYVENEHIDIPNLFVRPVSDKDDKILQSLADRVTEPQIFLQMPKLIKIFIANVQSDIGVKGLWELYQVFRKLNHSQLSKIVLWGEKVKLSGEDYWFISPYDWHNVVYEVTK